MFSGSILLNRSCEIDKRSEGFFSELYIYLKILDTSTAQQLQDSIYPGAIMMLQHPHIILYERISPSAVPLPVQIE